MVPLNKIWKWLVLLYIWHFAYLIEQVLILRSKKSVITLFAEKQKSSCSLYKVAIEHILFCSVNINTDKNGVKLKEDRMYV